MTIPLSEARHEAANLLYSCTEIADRKDVAAVVDLAAIIGHNRGGTRTRVPPLLPFSVVIDCRCPCGRA